MNRFFPFLALALAASLLAADEPKPAVPAPQSTTTDMVEAARGAKARRKSSSTKVITNADVKKSRGKIVERKGSIDVVADKPQPTMTEAHQARLAAEKEARERLASAEARVAELEKELAAVEQSYYEESDLERRDGEIVRRFDTTRKNLDEANAALLEARRLLEPFEPAARAAEAPSQEP